MLRFFTEMRILPPFPQGPQTFVARHLECIRCREVFTIAEDHPKSWERTEDWQSPHDQYPTTTLRFDRNREQVGIIPETRSQPVVQATPEEEPAQIYHVNCPRCGADNRNWLFVSENIRPYRANNVLTGGIILVLLFALSIGYLTFPLTIEWNKGVLGLQLAIICLALAGSLPMVIAFKQWPKGGPVILFSLGILSIGYVVFSLATGWQMGVLDLIFAIVCLALAGSLPLIIILRQWPKIGGVIVVLLGILFVSYLAYTTASGQDISILDLILAIACLALAGALPLIIVPDQWQKVRNYQLTRRFLPMLSEQEVPPVLSIVVIIYIAFILAVPGVKFGMIPIACYAVPICDQIGERESTDFQQQAEAELELWGKLLYSGTLISVVSSIFALLAVNEIVSTVNRHLPRPIFANTSHMVRVTLWEAKRALEIEKYFQEIQWTLTRRNDLGGIDMVGYYRDPPEILPNGRLDEEVRRQVYAISTDRWCVIVSTSIDDDKGPRPAGGKYYAVPIPRDEPIPIMATGRERY